MAIATVARAGGGSVGAAARSRAHACKAGYQAVRISRRKLAGKYRQEAGASADNFLKVRASRHHPEGVFACPRGYWWARATRHEARTLGALRMALAVEARTDIARLCPSVLNDVPPAVLWCHLPAHRKTVIRALAQAAVRIRGKEHKCALMRICIASCSTECYNAFSRRQEPPVPKISVLMPEADAANFEAYCEERGYKKSTLIVRLIREHLEREGYPQQPSLLSPQSNKLSSRRPKHGAVAADFTNKR